MLADATWITTQEVLWGFLISIIVGIAIALFVFRFQWAERAVYPLIVLFQVVPKVALAPSKDAQARAHRRDGLLPHHYQHGARAQAKRRRPRAAHALGRLHTGADHAVASRSRTRCPTCSRACASASRSP